MGRKITRGHPYRRNIVAANSPLMRKGGPHGKTRKAERRASKMKLHDAH